MERRKFPITSQMPTPLAARKRLPVCFNNVFQSREYIPDPCLADTKAELALPMIAGDRLIGVLDLHSTQINRFTPESIQILTTLAEQIGIAVRNAQLFAEAEAAREMAEEANRVKSQFLANMSHELRTPLNAILNFTAFVADGVFGPVNEEQVEALQQSIASGKHLLSLINDILDLTKIEVGLMDLFIQEVDFNEALNAIVSIARGLIKGKPLELITDIQPNLPRTFGDKRRIRQVILNLVSNAVKFTPNGSITIAARSEENQVHIVVADTGIGIAPKDQHLVFEPFRQASHDLLGIVGTGLGLPISKFFVEAHGGTLWFESEVGKGTTFHAVFLLRSEDEANAANALNSAKVSKSW